MPREEKKTQKVGANRNTGAYFFPVFSTTEEGLWGIKIGGYLEVLLEKFFNNFLKF
jgi:hypothetical protein